MKKGVSTEMDKYEKSARQIMQRGEKIISQKRKKIRAINRISFSVSGLCAALAVIFFINNTDIDNIDKDNMNNSDIIITTTEKFVEHDKKTTEISTNHTISADNKIYSAATTACTSEIISSETAFAEHISPETTEAVSCYIPDEMPDTTQSEGIYEDTEISSISLTEEIIAETDAEQGRETTVSEIPEEKYTEIHEETYTEPSENVVKSFTDNDTCIEYTYTNKSVSEQITGDFIKSKKANELSFDIYSINMISTEYLIAIKMKNEFFLYQNCDFSPSNLQEFMEKCGIEEYAVFDSLEYYDYENRCTVTVETDSEYVKNIIFADKSTEVLNNIGSLINTGGISMKDISGDMALICSMPDISVKIGFKVSKSGYVSTNMIGKGICFFIGEENAEKLISGCFGG